MKRTIIFTIVLLCLCFAYASISIDVPNGLTDHEAEIYREGYLAGYNAAQQLNTDERHPENDDNHYVVNKKSKKFHYPSCNGVQSMNEKNKLNFYGTREEAIAQGYEPCGMCDP